MNITKDIRLPKSWNTGKNMNVRIQIVFNGTKKKDFGEPIVARREEEKVGAATAWKQRSWISKASLRTCMGNFLLLANLVLKQWESEKKVERSREEELSIFTKSAFAKSALICQILISIKSKQKRISRWGYTTAKLLMILIKQLLTHSSSQNLLIWVPIHLDSLLLCSLLRASFKVSILRFCKIFRNLNLARLQKMCLISKKKEISKDMRRLSSP